MANANEMTGWVDTLRNLKTGQELCWPNCPGGVWLRLSAREFKFSPYGMEGDFDRGCQFWDASELADLN